MAVLQQDLIALVAASLAVGVAAAFSGRVRTVLIDFAKGPWFARFANDQNLVAQPGLSPQTVSGQSLVPQSDFTFGPILLKTATAVASALIIVQAGAYLKLSELEVSSGGRPPASENGGAVTFDVIQLEA